MPVTPVLSWPTRDVKYMNSKITITARVEEVEVERSRTRGREWAYMAYSEVSRPQRPSAKSRVLYLALFKRLKTCEMYHVIVSAN
jgi:hypothetical protein